MNLNIESFSEWDSLMDRIMPNNIYDDVEQLMTDMATVKEQLETCLPDTSDDLTLLDLNAQIGKIIVGYGNHCTNKPTSVNGYFINIPHSTMPDLYGKQIWFTRATNEIFIRNLENGTFGEWIALNSDTGWIDLPLADGITAYNTVNKPQYRKIGSQVFLRGSVKGIIERNTIISTLPEGFRPTIAHPYVQNTSLGAGNIAIESRMVINSNGELRVEAISEGGAFGAERWFPIGTTFLVD